MNDRPRPDFVLPLATIALLLSIGVPAWRRGQLALGVAGVVAAAILAAWVAFAWLRSRR